MTSSTPFTVSYTFIRHGESTDNLKSVWAGWKDAPLSNHGMKQARSLGRWFATNNTHFTTIYSSTLQRAVMTADAILEHQVDPKPPLIKSISLREQHFGQAEGHLYRQTRDPNLTLEEHYSRGIFPHLRSRSESFPGGESKDDLAKRAEDVIRDIILPSIVEAMKEGRTDYHVAIVSHGLFIKELIDRLLKRRAGVFPEIKYQGLRNTGWTRILIGIDGNVPSSSKNTSKAAPDLSSSPLLVRITQVNRHEHLDSISRQKGGIGSAAHDPKQKGIRDFFGGASTRPQNRR
ncbi:phosphoglycerate mutase-like protein [Dendrothele bispora CBS 962.96]|uniref:Phosphoglycerate mutase-like protein n=1 Tax=Dendrothele bispora (strain CBS 962.96) TaxID=1314807 RepID=A0A4V4HH04_DENBC|nr:phosphoglycerate mutase-like protein [Dendrothele bispora CBS 962.96]